MTSLIPDVSDVAPALEALRLALSPVYEWVLTFPGLAAFAVGWTLFCIAMLYAFLKADSRPEMVSRQIAEADQKRKAVRS